jgi:hypothetical protein
MIELYLYLPADEADIAVECGVSLSSHADREITDADGTVRKCISALMNPKDRKVIKSERLKCLGLKIDYKSCLVADRSLFEASMHATELRRLYNLSAIPAANYVFGRYRIPECLIFTSILPEDIYLADKMLDTPLIIPESEEYYPSAVAQAIAEELSVDAGYTAESPCGWELLLSDYFKKLADEGIMSRYEIPSANLVVFENCRTGRAYVLKSGTAGL